MDSWGNIDPTPATCAFTVDITPPTVVIDSPARHAILSHCIPVVGSAFDDSPIHDFDYYSLYYAMGDEETELTEWKPIFTDMHDEIRNDTLAVWMAEGLRGTYQIKLFAKDSGLFHLIK